MRDRCEQICVVFDRAQLPSRSNMMTDSEPFEASDLVNHSTWDPIRISAVIRTAIENGPKSK